MSEETGGVNLEDDGPAALPEPVAGVEPAVEAAPPAEPENEPAEVEAVEVAGKKYVPVAAVIAERKERQRLAPLADRAAALELEVANNRPWVEFLRANPHLMQQPQVRQPDPVPAAPTEDPDAVEAAKLMDFYTPDGKPDTARGSQWLKLQDRRNQRTAAEAVRPYQESAEQAQSNVNFQMALSLKDADGNSPSREALTQVWQQILKDPGGLKITSSREAAAFLAMTAIGMDRMTGKSKPATTIVQPPPPALVTEAPGGNPRQRPAMSGLEERIAKERQMNTATWLDRTKGFTPGRESILED